MTSDFDLSASLFSQNAFSYPNIYDLSALDFGVVSESAEDDASGGLNVSPQQVFGQQSPCVLEWQDNVPDNENQVNRPFKSELNRSDFSEGDYHSKSTKDEWSSSTSTQDQSGTDVDTLMKMIQSKAEGSTQQTQIIRRMSSSTRGSSSDVRSSAVNPDRRELSSSRRQYPCRVQSCAKIFTQKTHLEIHTRSHTGFKPFVRYLSRPPS